VNYGADGRASALERLAESVADQAVVKNHVKERCGSDRKSLDVSATGTNKKESSTSSSSSSSSASASSPESLFQSLANSILSTASNALNINITMPNMDKNEDEVSATQSDASPSSSRSSTINIASSLSSMSHRMESCARGQSNLARSAMKTQLAFTRLIWSLGSKDVDARMSDMADAIEQEVDDGIEANRLCKEASNGNKGGSMGGVIDGLTKTMEEWMPLRPERSQRPPNNDNQDLGGGLLPMDPPFVLPFIDNNHNNERNEPSGGSYDRCGNALDSLSHSRASVRSMSEDLAGAIDYRRASKDCPTLVCMEVKFSASVTALAIARLDVIEHCPCSQEKRKEEKKHEEFNQPGRGLQDAYSSDSQPGSAPPQIFSPQPYPAPTPIHTQSGDAEPEVNAQQDKNGDNVNSHDRIKDQQEAENEDENESQTVFALKEAQKDAKEPPKVAKDAETTYAGNDGDTPGVNAAASALTTAAAHATITMPFVATILLIAFTFNV